MNYQHKHILTFNNSKTPIKNKNQIQARKGEKYIPNPRQCHNCQKYSHLKEVCSRKPVCVKCGVYEPDHTDVCTNNLNCNESHRADLKLCKIWEKEREILKIQVTQNISFLEARLVEMPFIKPTFAKITKSPPNENQINTKNDKPNKWTTKPDQNPKNHNT